MNERFSWLPIKNRKVLFWIPYHSISSHLSSRFIYPKYQSRTDKYITLCRILFYTSFFEQNERHVLQFKRLFILLFFRWWFIFLCFRFNNFIIILLSTSLSTTTTTSTTQYLSNSSILSFLFSGLHITTSSSVSGKSFISDSCSNKKRISSIHRRTNSNSWRTFLQSR